MRAWVVVVVLVVALVAGTGLGAAAPAAPGLPDVGNGVTHVGPDLVDRAGRVLVPHGLNMVPKLPPYTAGALGFDDDDAAFLAANGFTVVRLGVVWKAIEPQPGRYDDAYLAQVRRTVDVLAAHGVMTLLDMHQDLYSARFGGEGAPDWAVLTDGLPPGVNTGFPQRYVTDVALQRAFDHFWNNDPGPGGVGLVDRYAAMWAHVAGRFRGAAGVLGFDLANEPFPGTGYALCANPVVGCPTFDAKLAAGARRITAAIRAVEPATLLFSEPHFFFQLGAPDTAPATGDRNAGFSFHDYCLTASLTQRPEGCSPFDDTVFAHARQRAARTGDALLLTEFGATGNTDIVRAGVARADRAGIGWIEWAYCGCGDPTTIGDASSEGLVRDPARPPTGANVNTAALRTLAEPHPMAVAGTPAGYGFDPSTTTFRMTWTTDRVDRTGRFGPGTPTTIAVPAVQYPGGFRVDVTGGRVTSAPRGTEVDVVPCPGATAVGVRITPGAGGTATCR